MKRILFVMLMVLVLSACGKESVTLSDSSIDKINAAEKEKVIRDFWENIFIVSSVYGNVIGYDETKYQKITTYSAVVTTPSDIYFDVYKLVANGDSYKATVRTLYKNYYLKDTILCSSELYGNEPRYSNVVYKNLDISNILKISGTIYYKNWDSTNGGALSESEEKNYNFSQAFSSIDSVIKTGIGRDESNNSQLCIYRDDKIAATYRVGYIKDVYIKKNDIVYYTAVGSDFEKTYTINLIKENGKYKINMTNSFD